MNLTIDIGNTHTRMALFSRSQMLCEWTWEPGTLGQKLGERRVERCAVGCVGTFPEALREELRESGAEVTMVSGLTPTPLTIALGKPETLGADRLAAAVGAWMQQKGKPLLVIDCGTCLTVDYVSARGEYLGGNISPGEALRLNAMHDYTALLPSCGIAENVPLVGTDTVGAMQAGARLGLTYEIRGYVDDFLAGNPEGHVFLSGGGLPELHIKEKKCFTIDKSLVLRGLNEILNETTD